VDSLKTEREKERKKQSAVRFSPYRGGDPHATGVGNEVWFLDRVSGVRVGDGGGCGIGKERKDGPLLDYTKTGKGVNSQKKRKKRLTAVVMRLISLSSRSSWREEGV